MKDKKKVRYSFLDASDGRVRAIVIPKHRRGLGSVKMVVTIGIIRQEASKRSRRHASKNA